MYEPEDLGTEVVAPAGYYTPLEEHVIDHDGEPLLYVVGRTSVETSCCGVGDWEYVRVEGYVEQAALSHYEVHRKALWIETIDSDDEKKQIAKLLLDKHPGARIEFR
jgi:hypothetical protein